VTYRRIILCVKPKTRDTIATLWDINAWIVNASTYAITTAVVAPYISTVTLRNRTQCLDYVCIYRSHKGGRSKAVQTDGTESPRGIVPTPFYTSNQIFDQTVKLHSNKKIPQKNETSMPMSHKGFNRASYPHILPIPSSHECREGL
jgi:hypothetical protein